MTPSEVSATSDEESEDDASEDIEVEDSEDDSVGDVSSDDGLDGNDDGLVMSLSELASILNDEDSEEKASDEPELLESTDAAEEDSEDESDGDVAVLSLIISSEDETGLSLELIGELSLDTSVDPSLEPSGELVVLNSDELAISEISVLIISLIVEDSDDSVTKDVSETDSDEGARDEERRLSEVDSGTSLELSFPGISELETEIISSEDSPDPSSVIPSVIPVAFKRLSSVRSVTS